MGTNFYARIIPSVEQKEKLIEAINNNDFESIKDKVTDMYGRITYYGGVLTGGEIHLGKRSGGWKFLWNPNVYIHRNGYLEEGRYVPEPSTLYYLYPLTKEGIHGFIMQEDIEVYDEYGEKQDKENFFKEAIEWTTWRGEEAWDSKSYEEYEKKQNPSYRVFKSQSELITLLQDNGVSFISESQSDFYSDGLRFATTTEFS